MSYEVKRFGNEILEDLNIKLRKNPSRTLVTAIEVCGMRSHVHDRFPLVRIASGSVLPTARICETIQFYEGKKQKKLVVPFESHLFWAHAMKEPLNVNLKKKFLYSLQNYGADLLDWRVSRIAPLTELLPPGLNPVQKFSIYIGTEEANRELQIWAKALGLNLKHASEILQNR